MGTGRGRPEEQEDPVLALPKTKATQHWTTGLCAGVNITNPEGSSGGEPGLLPSFTPGYALAQWLLALRTKPHRPR